MTATMHTTSVHAMTGAASGSANTCRSSSSDESGEVDPDDRSFGRPTRDPSSGLRRDVAPSSGRTFGRSRNAHKEEFPPSSETPVPETDRARVYVPGYGWVMWSEPLLDAQARYLSLIHRPTPRQVRYRFRWWVLPIRESDMRRCRFCGDEWPCAEAAWAIKRLSPARTTRSGGRRGVGGRHRRGAD